MLSSSAKRFFLAVVKTNPTYKSKTRNLEKKKKTVIGKQKEEKTRKPDRVSIADVLFRLPKKASDHWQIKTCWD